MRAETATPKMLQMSVQPGTGREVLDGGLVGTMSVDVDNRTGSPSLTIWFVNPMLQPVEFTLPPLQACRVMSAMAKAQAQIKWESFKLANYRKPKGDYRRSDAPTGDFGPMSDAKTFVDLDTGNMYFAIDFPVFSGKPPLGFTLDPACCLNLLMALYKLYEMYDWDGHNAAKGATRSVN